ncbi:TIM barrel protein [Paralimibaculum aggregatum]|uniref:TIM barrel protein n=1 Tax=Paralimibaculum aggregatum TaxID=3036245 RepID=A0ABQ6LKW5_9RHOB|nr:sugar phosphate isomerase/epimerase family protein [Limibaculum sp. NKW23]GMG83880.1 TIM barrel protein [Limibaculum sp. NKW23]
MAAITGVGLSTADYALTLRELGPALDWFEQLGVDAVELSLSNFEVIGGCQIYGDRLKELRRICADRPFGYTVHGPILSSFTDRTHLALQKAAAAACLEVSGSLGATAQVHHAGLLPVCSVEQREDLLAIEREALAEIAPVAQAHGVVFCVETLFGRLEEWTASPAELARQIRAVDHPNIRATIDFSHVFLNAAERGFDPMEELEELAPLAAHLHVHDSFALPRSFSPYSRSEAILFGIGDLHLPPGRGSLPWERLARLPYGGPAVANLELTTRHRDQAADAVGWTRAWVGQAAEAAVAAGAAA